MKKYHFSAIALLFFTIADLHAGDHCSEVVQTIQNKTSDTISQIKGAFSLEPDENQDGFYIATDPDEGRNVFEQYISRIHDYDQKGASRAFDFNTYFPIYARFALNECKEQLENLANQSNFICPIAIALKIPERTDGRINEYHTITINGDLHLADLAWVIFFKTNVLGLGLSLAESEYLDIYTQVLLTRSWKFGSLEFSPTNLAMLIGYEKIIDYQSTKACKFMHHLANGRLNTLDLFDDPILSLIDVAPMAILKASKNKLSSYIPRFLPKFQSSSTGEIKDILLRRLRFKKPLLSTIPKTISSLEELTSMFAHQNPSPQFNKFLRSILNVQLKNAKFIPEIDILVDLAKHHGVYLNHGAYGVIVRLSERRLIKLSPYGADNLVIQRNVLSYFKQKGYRTREFTSPIYLMSLPRARFAYTSCDFIDGIVGEELIDIVSEKLAKNTSTHSSKIYLRLERFIKDHFENVANENFNVISPSEPEADILSDLGLSNWIFEGTTDDFIRIYQEASSTVIQRELKKRIIIIDGGVGGGSGSSF